MNSYKTTTVDGTEGKDDVKLLERLLIFSDEI
jgi:hypothetical protein